MTKFNDEIMERLKEGEYKEQKDMWIDPTMIMGLLIKGEYFGDGKVPKIQKYINIQLVLNKKEIQNIKFKYKKQVIIGTCVVDAIELIFGKYNKDIIIKFGVIDDVVPMLCIIQTFEYDYKFILAPMSYEDLDNSNDDFFDIEKNATSKVNYMIKSFEI